MGVHGLWKLLESTGKPINPETLEGKVLAVDISIWLNQAVKGVRDRDGNSVHNAHLLTLFNRICKLLFFRIKPVFVFDGEAPLLKKQTLALRRQRKEELTHESKQTNDKLLRTFLKRQAIKAALGDKRTDPLPSISSVRRDEVDDMYVLPALPPPEEKEINSSEEEEEKEWEEMVESYHMYQGGFCEDPNSVDINSEEFASLPPEMKHDILKDMKEFTKRRRTMYRKPPEQSGDFSQYQLAGLLQRNHLNQRLEGVEREMSQRSAGGAPQLHGHQDGDRGSHDVESRRLVSEDSAHYILIKRSKDGDQVPEKQPAAPPWAGGPLSSGRTQGADRPEPLWRPISEEDEEQGPSPSSASKPSVCPQADTSPPSPRTLQAIQEAMSDSWDGDKADGSVSPRTLLAIQRAEEGGVAPASMLSDSANVNTKQHTRESPALLVVSSSEEDTLADVPPVVIPPANEQRSLRDGRDALLVSSSDDELEVVAAQRARAVPDHTPFHKAGETGSKMGLETQFKPAEVLEHHQDILINIHSVERESRDTPSSSGVSLHLPKQSLIAEAEAKSYGLLSEKRSEDDASMLEESGKVKAVTSDNSDSEESFLEVSEGEEDVDDSLKHNRGLHLDNVQEDQKEERQAEEEIVDASSHSKIAVDLTETQEEDPSKASEESRRKDGTQTEASPTAVTPEWEHEDMEELEALDSVLQVQQSNLREQRDHLQRMASTVTGQMCLESQELLRLFGVPYLVAPMEAEAQCAVLDRTDLTHGTITDDSDIWLFGGRHVYKNFFSQNKYVEHYQCSDLQNQLGLDRTKLINLAYLLGSDYTEGIPGVGYVTGMELLNEFLGPGLEPLVQFSDWWSAVQKNKRLVADPRDSKVKRKLRNLKLKPGFPNPVVAQAYLHPAVDQSESSFSWGRPHLDLIKEFCQSRFGWSFKKTEDMLQPVMKQLSAQQTQLRIDSFFRLEQQERQAIRSQRLRRAVTCMKRKEQETEEEEQEEEEEEAVEQAVELVELVSPAKKRRLAGHRAKAGESGLSVCAGALVGGGFVGSEVVIQAPPSVLQKGGDADQKDELLSLPKENTPQCKAPPQVAAQSSGSSSSSSSDEDSVGGREAALVTARSAFEGQRRGRGRRGPRGPRRGKGKKPERK